MMKIEAIFGGILALFVLAVAAYAIVSVNVRRPADDSGNIVVLPTATASSEPSGICQCFNEGFKLAGSDVGVMSSQYRTGFEQCRAMLGVPGGDAWTAGWNARLSAKPYEASCRSYLRRAA
jgi:hypothetical protein